MKKIIRRIFKALLIGIGVILLLLIFVPMIFKDRILTEVEKEINKQVEANVTFQDVKIGLFRSFPNLNLGLIDLTVTGKDRFHEDTLVAFNAFRVEVDLVSAIKGHVQVKGILLDRPLLNARVLADSTANWDIMPVSEVPDYSEEKAEEQEERKDPEEEGSTMRIALERFEIREGVIRYSDETAAMQATLNDFGLSLSGDFGADYSDMDLAVKVGAIDVIMDKVKYLNKASFSFETALGANLKEMIFTLKKNKLALNAIGLEFSGQVAMPTDDVAIDLSFATTNTSFKHLLSMVPAIYMEGYESLQATGSLKLDGKIMGTYSAEKETLPSAIVHLGVENGRIQYPDLPESVEAINILLDVNMDGQEMDNTTVDLSKFHFEVAGNPFNIFAHVSTPMTDPGIRAGINGKIVLSSLANAIPLEDMRMDGTIEADVHMNGHLSSIEEEQYEQFNAGGEVVLSGFSLAMPDLPETLMIPSAKLAFSPRFLSIDHFKGKIGESDFHLVGTVEQYIGYALSDETLRADFAFRSEYFDARPFMASTPAEQENVETAEVTTDDKQVVDSVAGGAFEVPKGMDVKLQCNMDKLLYDKLVVENMQGTILVKDQEAHLNDLRMDLLEGSLSVDGMYSTKVPELPKVTMDMNVENLHIKSATQSFSMLDTLAPVLKQCDGNISLQLTYSGLLDAQMSPVLNSVDGYGRLQSESIQVINSKTYDKLAGLLKLGDKFGNSFKDIDVSFTIQEGNIVVSPFDTQIGDIKAVIAGRHGLDQTMDYDINMQIPRSYFGGAANDVLDDLLAKASDKGVNVSVGEYVPVKARIYGDMQDPKLGLNYRESPGDGKADLKAKAKAAISQQKEAAEQKARAEAEARAKKIVADAEAQAAKIKKEARESADKLLKEADEKAAKMIKEAEKEGPFAKIAAEKAAEALKNEAKKTADKLIKEAHVQADKLVADAHERAEKISNE